MFLNIPIRRWFLSRLTAETYLRRAHLTELRTSGAVGQFLARQAEVFAADEEMETKYGSTCERLPLDIINVLHYPLACAIALGWDQGVEITELPLVFEEKGRMASRPNRRLGTEQQSCHEN